MSAERGVEQATAAPGEKRSLEAYEEIIARLQRRIEALEAKLARRGE